MGAFRRAVAERLHALRADAGTARLRAASRAHEDAPPVQELLAWLRADYALDANSAWQVVDYVAGQLDHAGAISSDRQVLVELFDDALGDPRLVIQAPFGGKVNGLWGLALAGALRERTGVEVEVESNDDGILFRFPAGEADFPLDLVTAVGRGRGPGAHLAGAAQFGGLRRPVPPERGAGAAAARPAAAASARPSGSSGCGPRTCSRSCASSRISPSSPKPTGTAWKR